MGLFYSNLFEQYLIGFAYARYLYDPHKAQSKTRYVFIYRCITSSWHSTKQTFVTTSNYVEILAIHEAKS